MNGDEFQSFTINKLNVIGEDVTDLKLSQVELKTNFDNHLQHHTNAANTFRWLYGLLIPLITGVVVTILHFILKKVP